VMADPGHILFGTDYPFVKAAAEVKELEEIQFSDSERDAIDRGNALALLPRLRAS
jgi:predicted TIM-barrel fold metal-dependent hydrolase